MYNRYYTDESGVLRKESMEDPAIQNTPSFPEIPLQALSEIPKQQAEMLDRSDLVTLFVLLTIAGDRPENRTTALMTLAFYFFL